MYHPEVLPLEEYHLAQEIPPSSHYHLEEEWALLMMMTYLKPLNVFSLLIQMAGGT